MFLKLIFKQLSLSRQANYLKKKGIMLGIRFKNGRKVYTYMLRDLFVEVIYKNDKVEDGPEKLSMLSGLKNLNNYLENEFKTSF